LYFSFEGKQGTKKKQYKNKITEEQKEDENIFKKMNENNIFERVLMFIFLRKAEKYIMKEKAVIFLLCVL